jgi:hypothetical protein
MLQLQSKGTEEPGASHGSIFTDASTSRNDGIAVQ